jgi:membrane protein
MSRKFPIIKKIVSFFDNLKIPGLEGMSVYDFLKLYLTGIIKGMLTARAGSIAFSFFIALFPFALFLLTLIPYIPIDGFQEDLLAFIYKSMPSKVVSDAVNDVLTDISLNKYGELLSFGFILSMFLMTNGVNAILSGFEYTFHQIETRTVIRQYVVAFFISILLAILLMVTVSTIIFLEFLIKSLEHQGMMGNTPFWINAAQVVVFIFMIFVGTSLLYYFGTKEGKNLSFFSPGTILTTVLVVLNSKLFSIYIERFAQYNKLYGSIGTVLAIMIFIWINSIILLLGFELNTSITKLHNQNDLNKKQLESN